MFTNDENRQREASLFSARNRIEFPTPNEISAFIERLWGPVAQLSESDRLFAAVCALMLITGKGPEEALCVSWTSLEGEHVNLTDNLYVTVYHLPQGAAQSPDSARFHPVDQRLALPIPSFIASAFKASGALGKTEVGCLSQWSPISWPILWHRLEALLPGQLLPRRRGQSFFSYWLSMALTAHSDKEVAFGVTQHAGFSSQHHLYYPTLEKKWVVTAWCGAMSAIFGTPLSPPDTVSGYVGSPIFIQSNIVSLAIERGYQRFPVGSDWRRFPKPKLMEYYNTIVLELWVALASNFALRRLSNEVNATLLSATQVPLVKVLDKQVDKKHPERYLPMSTVTRALIKHHQLVSQFMAKRWHIGVPSDGLYYVAPDSEQVSPLSREHINQGLFDGEAVPINVFRHAIASLMRTYQAGPLATALLGHRPDKVVLPNPDILHSTASGELEVVIQTIQQQEFGLKQRGDGQRTAPKHHADLKYLVLKERWEEALTLHLALTGTPVLLNALANHGGLVIREAGFHFLQCGPSFKDYLSDEQVALLGKVCPTRLRQVARKAQQRQQAPDWQGDAINEAVRAHVQAYTNESNTIDIDCLTSLFSDLPALPPKLVEGLFSLPKQRLASERAMKRLIDTLDANHHSSPESVLYAHLLDLFTLNAEDYPTLPELLDAVQCQHDTVEVAIYRYMSRQMQSRREGRKRQIAGRTWQTEYSKVYRRLLRLMADETEVSQLSPPEVAKYHKGLNEEMDKVSLDESTRQSMAYAIKGVFAFLGDGTYCPDSPRGQKPSAMAKTLLWPHQYQTLLAWIANDAPLNDVERVLYACALIVMYKGGLRPNELSLLSPKHILGKGQELYVTSVASGRTKTLKSNRLIFIDHDLTEQERQLLEQWFHLSAQAKHVGSNALCNLSNVNVPRLNGWLKMVTNNPALSLYALRRSYANFHYLLMMGVHIPVVQAYFGQSALNEVREKLAMLWCLTDYEEEALLRALSLSMGHVHVATTMHSYICTLGWVRLYHAARSPSLSERCISQLLGIPHTTYRDRKRAHPAGIALGTHPVPVTRTSVTSTTFPSLAVTPEPSRVLQARALDWLTKIDAPDAQRFWRCLQKKALTVGLTLSQLQRALNSQDLYVWLAQLEACSSDEQQRIYHDWLSLVQSKAKLDGPLKEPKFIEILRTLGWEYRVKARKYVKVGQSRNRNALIATALLVMHERPDW